MDVPPIFERLNLELGYWKLLVKDFGRVFGRCFSYLLTLPNPNRFPHSVSGQQNFQECDIVESICYNGVGLMKPLEPMQ